MRALRPKGFGIAIAIARRDGWAWGDVLFLEGNMVGRERGGGMGLGAQCR